ncbi:MAG: pyridoxal-dependent decarboxylase, partial [Actinomycetia bacterium]|nr:pyridoxal-dependent decarboxylase [Actinomycetes bacterium]
MSDILHARSAAADALGLVHQAAGPYLDTLSDRMVRDPAAEELIGELDGPLPRDGVGAVQSIEELLRVGTGAAVHSTGPRFFHFVVGGATPAAMAGDWV